MIEKHLFSIELLSGYKSLILDISGPSHPTYHYADRLKHHVKSGA